MKIKSWVKRIWDKWFPEIKEGITSRDEKGKTFIRQKRYPVCHGNYLSNEYFNKKKINQLT